MPPLPSDRNGQSKRNPSIVSTIPPLKMIWVRQEFTIQTGMFNEDEGMKPLNPRRVQGSMIHGVGVYKTDQLRVLRGPGNPALWRVCALGCGLRITDCLTEDDAKRIGEVFSGKFTRAMQEKTKERTCMILPGWVKEWVKACEEKKGYVPWESFA